jgi:hypothetical protein
MPPLSLFDNSRRPDRLVMPACAICNQGTSTADLIAAIIGRWDPSGSDQSNLDHGKLLAQLAKQAPDVWKELKPIEDPIEKERRRRHLVARGVPVPHDASLATIGQRTIQQLKLFAHKSALALYFEHFRRPLPPTGRVSAHWRPKEDFARGVPKHLLALLPRYGTLSQGKWNERETFEYRYDLNQDTGIFASLARLRHGLYVAGFIVADPSVLGPEDDGQWLAPAEPSMLLAQPRFQIKAR